MNSKPKVPSCLCLTDLGWHYRHVPPIVFPKLNCTFLGSGALCGLSVLPFPSSHLIANDSLLLSVQHLTGSFDPLVILHYQNSVERLSLLSHFIHFRSSIFICSLIHHRS